MKKKYIYILCIICFLTTVLIRLYKFGLDSSGGVINGLDAAWAIIRINNKNSFVQLDEDKFFMKVSGLTPVFLDSFLDEWHRDVEKHGICGLCEGKEYIVLTSQYTSKYFVVRVKEKNEDMPECIYLMPEAP